MIVANASGTPYWSLPEDELFQELESSLGGLSESEAKKRKAVFGANTLAAAKKQSGFMLFLSQFNSPITLTLLAAAALSFALDDRPDAMIIAIIVLISCSLGYWQERTAGKAISQLLSLVQIRAIALRDGQKVKQSTSELVPGDVIILGAGDVVPADCVILESDGLFIDEAAFTGETFPVEKAVAVLPANTPLAKRINYIYMGSHVVSGAARALVVQTGEATEFGHINKTLSQKAPETSFTIGIRKFGYMLMQITLVMVVLLFGINVLLHKPVMDSLLFTLAIAVGLTPQLLPVIITVNFSQGAKRMAQKRVIVKRLSSIENFGNMNVLCSDKTGTLTEGKVRVSQWLDCFGKESLKVLLMAKVNASLQQGYKNLIDEAVMALPAEGADRYSRLDEIPYDFIRKRLSVLVACEGQEARLISKGAIKNILGVCTHAIDKNGTVVPLSESMPSIQKLYEDLSSKGVRTLGVAYKDCGNTSSVSMADETGMIFGGIITLFDPIKPGIWETIHELNEYGVELKIITGDNVLIAKHMSEEVGLGNAIILTGSEMKNMSDAALLNQVVQTNVFAEIEPNQKGRIIAALKRMGKTVGYMGDGINDVSAIHIADVGLSVNTAVDAAKEAADMVLLDHDLAVLVEGVKEGRRTFANTQKYILMATSANFGNMFSMAGASLFMPFLPLLPTQILLTNLMTDFPSMAISTDAVDAEWIRSPHKWDTRFIKRFMLAFGILSSVFDYMTFGVLLYLFHAKEQEFHTGWFIESVVSATLIVLIVRSQKPFFKSKPSPCLAIASVLVAALVIIIPSTPLAELFGFTPVSLLLYGVILSIVALYILSAELMKRWFYRELSMRTGLDA